MYIAMACGSTVQTQIHHQQLGRLESERVKADDARSPMDADQHYQAETGQHQPTSVLTDE